MSSQLSTQHINFFMTIPGPCPYLPDQDEVKIFTYLDKTNGRNINDQLTNIGFRRAQNIAYRPACPTCKQCKSSRVLVQKFTASRSMKRILRRNSDLIRTIGPPVADAEHYALISKYLVARHKSGGMEGMSKTDFAELIEETCLVTELVDYRDKAGTLLASALIDQLADGPSMVYSFFDPKLAKRSLGNFMILENIERAKQESKQYLYLGFWIENSPKMSYKQRFVPLEVMQDTTWEVLGEISDG